MNFLKKLGQTLAGVGSVAAQVVGIPFVAAILGTYAGGKGQLVVDTVFSDLNAVASIVTTTEALFAATSAADLKTGPQKLAAAAPLVEKILLQWAESTLPKGVSVKHPERVAAGASQITSGMAEFLSGFEA